MSFLYRITGVAVLVATFLAAYPLTPLCAVQESISAVTAPSDTPSDELWRRTSDGWERAWWLVTPKTFYRPAIHPGWLVVAQVAALAAAYLATRRQRAP